MKLKVLAGMLVATTALALSPIDDLNNAIVELLKPINNNLTTAKLEFTKLDITGNRLNAAAANLDLRKQGELTHFELKPSVAYEAGEFEFDLTANMDLLALVDQETINEMGPGAAEIVRDFAQAFLEEYGDAATIDVRNTEEKYDDAGNLTMLSVLGEMTVDLTKLPEDVPVETVPVTRATLSMTVGLDTLSAQGAMTLNPAADFQEVEEMAVEYLNLLINQDERTMTELQEFVQMLDSWLDDIVNEGI